MSAAPRARPRRRFGALAALGLLSIAALGLGGCSADAAAPTGAHAAGETALPRLDGTRVTVLTGWSEQERAAFAPVVARFEQRTGAEVRLTDAPEQITAKVYHAVDASNLPDVALIRQPGLLRELVAARALLPLDASTRAETAAGTAEPWRALASVDGIEYGVWFAAGTSSSLWSRAGAAPPAHGWADFIAELRARPASAGPAVSLGAGSGWPAVDWFENLYLGSAGAEQYERLSRHEIPWTDPSVARALALLAELRDASGAVQPKATNETFANSLRAVFDSPQRAQLMLAGGSAVPADATATAFPAPDARLDGTVIGGTAAVRLKDSDGGAAFQRFLASPEAARLWVARGGISPNTAVDPGDAPSDAVRSAIEVVQPGPGGSAEAPVRFDLSDLAPSGFGGYPGSGAQAILREFLTSPAVGIPATQQRLERAAEAAWSTVPQKPSTGTP